jgi:hypothetical protein
MSRYEPVSDTELEIHAPPRELQVADITVQIQLKLGTQSVIEDVKLVHSMSQGSILTALLITGKI